jgi:hypothetical protein
MKDNSMHPYSINSEEHKSIPFYLGILAIILAYLLSYLSARLFPIPWWLDAPSVLGFYGILHNLFNKFFWKWDWLHSLGIIKTPILHGSWGGEVSSLTKHDDAKQKVNVKVLQTWTEMKILLVAPNSTSFSYEASIIIEGDDTAMLYYQYEGHPKHKAPETMHIHRGSVCAKLLSSSEINAEYYSGRDRQNIGTFEIKKVKE